MAAGKKSKPTASATRLVLMVVGVLLALGTPFAVAFLSMASRLQLPIIAGVEFSSVAVGLAVLYLALRGQGSSQSKG